MKSLSKEFEKLLALIQHQSLAVLWQWVHVAFNQGALKVLGPIGHVKFGVILLNIVFQSAQSEKLVGLVTLAIRLLVTHEIIVGPCLLHLFYF